MNLKQRIAAFSSLGEIIHKLSLQDRQSLAAKARAENPWFAEESVMLSLRGIEVLLEKGKLKTWAESYSPEPTSSKIVGIAMAGNIPLVGFHDFMCVLLSGHRLKAKFSSQDTVLPKFVLKALTDIEPGFSERVSLEDTLKGVDAMIATGSDNTARYFEYYFRNIPHIIRKNRASCAVVLGEETKEELSLLGKDVLSYFGLGCRNVSKIYVPEDFEVGTLIESWAPYRSVIEHHKYVNNYDYRKSIMLLDNAAFLDGEFILLRENKNLVSPIAVIHYEKYASLQDLKEKIENDRTKLQVIVSAKGWFPQSIPFGKAQLPEVNDYSDNVDTMRFLFALK